MKNTSSILVSVVNHNLPELTDNVVEQIQKDDKVPHEIMVFENGSTEKSKYSTHETDRNYFYGGAVNMIMDYFLNNTEHDYLMILNNDLIIHGYNYLSVMLNEMESSGVCMLSPAIINASVSQCYWKQMHNWLSGGTRYVPWIDFQAPMFNREICEIVHPYDNQLIYGWGQDILAGMEAENRGMTVGVTDLVCITHLNSRTLDKGIVDLNGDVIDLQEYCRRAETGMMKYMSSNGWWNQFMNFREITANYVWDETTS